MIYAAIKQHGPQRFALVVMWSSFPVHLSGTYTSRSKARYALNKLVGKDRILVSLNRLYEIHEHFIKEAFHKSREQKPKEIAQGDPIVADMSHIKCEEHNTYSGSMENAVKKTYGSVTQG